MDWLIDKSLAKIDNKESLQFGDIVEGFNYPAMILARKYNILVPEREYVTIRSDSSELANHLEGLNKTKDIRELYRYVSMHYQGMHGVSENFAPLLHALLSTVASVSYTNCVDSITSLTNFETMVTDKQSVSLKVKVIDKVLVRFRDKIAYNDSAFNNRLRDTCGDPRLRKKMQDLCRDLGFIEDEKARNELIEGFVDSLIEKIEGEQFSHVSQLMAAANSSVQVQEKE